MMSREHMRTLLLLTAALLVLAGCGGGFMGLAENRERRIDNPRSPLDGIVTVTKVQPIGYRKYTTYRREGKIVAEERRGAFVYFAVEDSMCIPAHRGNPGAMVMVTRRYKAEVSAAVPVAAESVEFHLVAPDKEKRSGLYAMTDTLPPRGAPIRHRPVSSYFSLAADGKLPGPVAGLPVTLYGRLPETVPHLDFFQADAGRIVWRDIDIPVSHVQYVGAVKEKVARAAYFTVRLPALAAGKYRTAVYFRDCTYDGDKSRITVPSQYKSVPPRIKPLVCEFEVKPPPAKLSAKSTKFVSGKPMEFVVTVKNPGGKPLKLRDVGWAPNWRFEFIPKGDDDFIWYARFSADVRRPGLRDVVVKADGEAKITLRLGSGSWQFVGERVQKIWTPPVVEALPPGKYTVIANYRHRAGHPTREVCPYWHGTIHAGPLEIEVVKPARK